MTGRISNPSTVLRTGIEQGMLNKKVRSFATLRTGRILQQIQDKFIKA